MGVVVLICLGVLASGIGMLWWRAMSRGPIERDTVLFIIKLFMGISVALTVVMLLYRYM